MWNVQIPYLFEQEAQLKVKCWFLMLFHCQPNVSNKRTICVNPAFLRKAKCDQLQKERANGSKIRHYQFLEGRETPALQGRGEVELFRITN